MKSHLDIEIEARPGEGFKPLVLPDDFSISVEEPNPVFNDTSFFSYPCSIPTAQNMAVLKNIAHRDSAMRGMDLEHARARVVADGLPLNSGQVITSEDAEIGPSFDFNIDAQTESFSDLIGDLECQDVKVKDHIVIGEKIGKIIIEGNISAQAIIECNPKYPDYPASKSVSLNDNAYCEIDSPQALGFSVPGKYIGFPAATVDDNGKPKIAKSYINVSRPYPFPYCNARVAYAHPDSEFDEETKTYKTEGVVQGNAKGDHPYDFGQYWCLDANRPQSGICFYVLYFLDCLFEQLGVSWDKSELLEIEDFTRLAFFTTHCGFDEEVKAYNVSYYNNGAKYSSLSLALDAIPEEDRVDGMDIVYMTTSSGYVRYTPLTSEWSSNPSDWRGPLTAEILVDDEINEWLSSRNCGGSINLLIYTDKVKDLYGQSETIFGDRNFTAEKETYPANEFIYEDYSTYDTWGPIGGGRLGGHTHRESRSINSLLSYYAEVYDMIANSKNFPNTSVSSVIKSLENSFGIRFCYDSERRFVTARLMRNVYERAETRKFNGENISMVPVNEKITGIRMAYSAESESKEQRNNIRDGIKDYDTEYDYIEYPKDRTITSKTYQQIVSEQGLVSSTNRNVYVDLNTGNSYRIKIDADAEKISLLRPVLFQVAQNKGIERGDCSEKNSSYIKEFISDFKPLTSNIINAQDYNSNKDGTVSPIFAPLLDVDMESEKVDNTIQMDGYSFGKMIYPSDFRVWDYDPLSIAFPEELHLLVNLNLDTDESYDPTQTDTGNSPLQDIDWGLTLCIMRGGGSDAEIINYDPNYDGFGNYRWKDTVATYEMYSDSIDPKGVVFDYNGEDINDGGGERFSLQICSWVQPEWSDVPLCIDDIRDSSGKIIQKIRSRGLSDSFMALHFYFLLHRKKYKVKARATIAQLLDIRNHWHDRYNIDGKIGFIDRLKYNIKRDTGVSDIEMDFYAI